MPDNATVNPMLDEPKPVIFPGTKPTYSARSWLKFIVPRLFIFPLIWDFLKLIVNYLRVYK